MNVTVLIENTSKNHLAHEHGVSLLIEYRDKKFLLDSGRTRLFSENAANMGISLGDVEYAVLSHGHYDHSGGFPAFFECNAIAPVYARREITGKYYSSNGGMHEISVPEETLAYSERFVFVSGNTKITDGVYLIGHSTDQLDKIGERSGLYKERASRIVPDDFQHEHSLVFDTSRGLVIFNSCSHGGVQNIIREAKAYCSDRPVYAYIGGLHMKGKDCDGKEICTFSDREIDLLCETIREEKISFVYTGHCTGLCGFEKVKERLGDTVKKMSTGMVFHLQTN